MSGLKNRGNGKLTAPIPWFLGLALVGAIGLSLVGDHPAFGATKNTTVCVTKSKVIILTNAKKSCGKNEKKVILSSTSGTSPDLCIHVRKKSISVTTTTRCGSGQVLATQFSKDNSIRSCTNKITRQIQFLSGSRCSRGMTFRSLPVRQVSEKSVQEPNIELSVTTTLASVGITSTTAPSTTVPVSTSSVPSNTTTTPPTTSTTAAPTTTTSAAPTTTTTVPPATIASFTAASTTINDGSSTTLTANFSGVSATINQSVGSISNGGSVTVSPSVTTTYTITVSNGVNHFITSSVTVQVNTLSITSQPQSLTTNNTNGAALSTTVMASGVVTAQWFKDGSSINGATTTSYLATQNGSYHVVVTSTLNGVTRSVTSNTAIFAINTVSISSQPTSALIGDNQTATFSVTASGSGTLTYQWTRNGVNISGATSSSYTTDVAGSYVVVVTSTLNGVVKDLYSSEGVLTVNTVIITSSPGDASITQGGSRTLAVSVSSSGGATITYLWYRDNVAISGATNNSYVATQGGTYKVRVTSARDGTTAVRFSTDAVLNEVPAAVITGVTASPASIAVGNSTTVTAVFSGGTAVLTPGNVSLTSGSGVSVSPSTTTLYTVTATNPAGQQASFTINIVVTSGTFSATANNGNANRWYGSKAVTLQSGKVLIVGSSNSSVVTDLYDPATNRFTRVGDLNQGRREPLVALLPNGKVIAIGGFSGSAYLSSAEIFDPVTETWTFTGSLATARDNSLSVTLSDGRILVAGGVTTGSVRLASVEIYNPSTGLFTAAASMPQARQGLTGALMANGNVFIAGGFNQTDGQMKSAIIYNVANDSWTTVSSQMNSGHMNSSQAPGAVTLLLPDGRLLIVGGWSSNIGVPTIEIYDPTTDSFVTSGLPQFPYGGSTTGHVMSNGLVVFFGGSGSGSVSNKAVIYDPISNTMTPEANTMTSSRYMHTSAMLSDGRIIIIGGTNTTNATADVYTQ